MSFRLCQMPGSVRGVTCIQRRFESDSVKLDDSENLRSTVINLYKTLIYLSRDWPTNLRPQIKNAFLKNKDVTDSEEIRKLIARGEYVSREIIATYHLKKYRTMKRRYYAADEPIMCRDTPLMTPDSTRTIMTSRHVLKDQTDSDTHSPTVKLMYEGRLARRILYLKKVSLLTSACLTVSFGYVISQKGMSLALASLGFAFTPFIFSPIAISWFFKRYITKLYYNPDTETFTACHYGLLLNTKSCTFKQEDVTKSEFTSMLNTFTVNKKPFFLHDEDLGDVQSVELYKKMVGL